MLEDGDLFTYQVQLTRKESSVGFHKCTLVCRQYIVRENNLSLSSRVWLRVTGGKLRCHSRGDICRSDLTVLTFCSFAATRGCSKVFQGRRKTLAWIWWVCGCGTEGSCRKKKKKKNDKRTTWISYILFPSKSRFLHLSRDVHRSLVVDEGRFLTTWLPRGGNVCNSHLSLVAISVTKSSPCMDKRFNLHGSRAIISYRIWTFWSTYKRNIRRGE